MNFNRIEILVNNQWAGNDQRLRITESNNLIVRIHGNESKCQMTTILTVDYYHQFY